MIHFDRAKEHVKRNKVIYIVGGVCLTVGALGGGLYATAKPEIIQKAQIQGFVVWKPKQIVVQFVERSTPSKPIHLKGTQQYFDSISAAARETGLDRPLISKQLSGYIPDVKGNVFEFIEVLS